ncbi:MAG: hypothetical protein EA390_04980 [Balneolaceae bacterium]|nr:MAG: hypothetical protein EA390_04980 [Balneolaceae bacterium]
MIIMNKLQIKKCKQEYERNYHNQAHNIKKQGFFISNCDNRIWYLDTQRRAKDQVSVFSRAS